MLLSLMVLALVSCSVQAEPAMNGGTDDSGINENDVDDGGFDESVADANDTNGIGMALNDSVGLVPSPGAGAGRIPQSRVVQEARRWLADRLGVPVGQVNVVSVEQREWPDSCLGLPGPDEVCLYVITPGYRIVFGVGGQEYVVRTNLDGSIIRLESDMQPGGDVVQKAREWLADRLGVPVSQIDVVSVEQVDWSDSCLGLGGPEESCALVITPGYRIIFEVRGKEYEVRTDATATAIRLNEGDSRNPPSEDRLRNTRWVLESFGPAGVEMPVVEGSGITLRFGNDGTIGGSGGCNSYGGDYQVDGSSISFSNIISTLIACVDESIMQQEQRYFGALQTANRFELMGNRLTIFYDGGVLNFVRGSAGGR